MFLNLGHTKLEAYTIARQFVKECYKVVLTFPSEERFILSQQIKKSLFICVFKHCGGEFNKIGGRKK